MIKSGRLPSEAGCFQSKAGILPCNTEMDGSLYLLRCWSRSYRYSLFGDDPGGDDRRSESEDKRDLMKVFRGCLII